MGDDDVEVVFNKDLHYCLTCDGPVSSATLDGVNRPCGHTGGTRLTRRTSESAAQSAAALAGSPLALLQPQTWSTTEMVRYEVALEILRELAAVTSAKLADAEIQCSGCAALLRERQTLLAGQARRLRPDDVEEIAYVHHVFGAELGRISDEE